MNFVTNEMSGDAMPSGAIMYMIHHIFLPPRLPNSDDSNNEHEMHLLKVTVDCLQRFKKCLTCEQGLTVDSVVAMVSNLMAVRESFGLEGGLIEGKLEDALKYLGRKGGTLPLHIRAQNAGVMISKVDDSINVEAFELSPLNESVITTKGRLRRSFPGYAISLAIDVFEEPGFQAMIAQALTKMSHQPAVETQPKTRKANQMHDEDRDTRYPKMISELFMGVLRTVGEPVDVKSLWKNTREEVMWLNSLLPWRRSPMWLLLRVAMQFVFSRSSVPSSTSSDLYKTFMVFFMSHVLDLSHQHSLPSDLLYAMNAKLARRLVKLGVSADESNLNVVHSVMRNTQKILCARWSTIMEQAEPHYDLSHIKCLDFSKDASHSLPALDQYVESLFKRENSRRLATFQPECFLIKCPADVLPTGLSSSAAQYMAFNLRAFEDWVAFHLRQWLEHHKRNTKTCGRLGDLIQSYHSVASPIYSGNPEATSMMLLNILEIWIACDKSAIHICEFLQDYDPGIPQELFQSLILPCKSQMDRLRRAEDYLSCRQERAKFGASCIFREFGLPNAFAVRYFSQSSQHNELLERIESEAARAREDKRREFRQKKEQYRSLIQRHDQSSCEYSEVIVDYYNDFREQRHDSSCKKCKYLSEAKSLKIGIYEWPLPSDALQAQSTVFELNVPCFFGHWRDATMMLLLNVLKSEHLSRDDSQPKISLRSYQGLSSFFTSFSSTQRIGLSSEAKPHAVTHRKMKSVSVVAEGDVCLNNGLRYQYCDDDTGTFVNNFRTKDEIVQLCTYRLPVQSRSVQKFLFRPAAMPSGPSPNTVIASQSSCPDHMSLDEYKALATTPLGYRIQWQNILLQLGAPSVDFKKVETGFVILQCIYQAGPPSGCNFLRTSHEILDDDKFAQALLESLHESLQRVKENWESSQALSVFVSVTLRLLSLTSTKQIRQGCLAYLSRVRAILFYWVNTLRDKAHEAVDDGHRADLEFKSAEIALICADSFNVEEPYLDDTLALPEDVSVFIQCSIVIQEGTYAISMASDPMISILYKRWKWLTYRSYTILAKRILEERINSLDDAIKKAWPAYQAGNRWRSVSEQIGYCLFNQTASQDGVDPLRVHFNLLTGELLVNGLPLARLPSNYEQHPTYRTLFGHAALHVMPSDMPGMQFSGRNKHAGFTIHLGISSVASSLRLPENDLLVQAVKGDRKYELIPSRFLVGELPVAFVDNFVHWYDTTDDCLEFRPIEDPWNLSPDNWKLTRVQDGFHWYLVKHGKSLVSLKSETAKVLSTVFSPLEDPLWIHLILHDSSLSLEIELPRLRLGFCLKLGESSVQSRQFRGMFIDTDQSLGTLVGLRSKLVLKHEKDGDRLVVIPDGQVSYENRGGYVHVSIKKSSAVKAHAYLIDSQIGRLVDNESLQSKLLLCHLHALTSFCLPDPFTRKTGTEQALSILKSAAVRSLELVQDNVDILVRIAHLTPGRSYYPAHERVMQTVKWSPELGFLAQHGHYYKCVKFLFDQAARKKLLYPELLVEQPRLNHVDSHLLERDCIRSSTLRVSGFGAEDHAVNHDTSYKARDRNQNSAGGSKAVIMSSLVYRGRTTLHDNVSGNLKQHVWKFLSQNPHTLGPSHQLKFSDLMYDAGLLANWSKFVAMHWSTLQRTMSQVHPKLDKFRLMMWLSTIAIAKNADMKILQALASFFTVPAIAQILAPSANSFRLSEGAVAKSYEVRSLIESAKLPFDRCPEARLSSNPDESIKAFKARRKSQFQRNQTKAFDRCTNALIAQWVCEVPNIPRDAGDISFGAYVDMSKAMEYVKPKFKTWFENHRFSKYLEQIEDVLSRQLIEPVLVSFYSFSIPAWNLSRRSGFVCIDDVLSGPAPSLLPAANGSLTDLVSFHTRTDKATPRLAAMIRRVEEHTSSKYEKAYVEDLRGSLDSLHNCRGEYYLQLEGGEVKKILLDYLNRCDVYVQNIYERMVCAASVVKHVENSTPTQSFDALAIAAGVSQWPRLSPVFFLQQLNRTRWPKISCDWKDCIIQYGLALTELQRAQRLVRSHENHADLVKELRNTGHTNWKPLKYPESLLLEVESGITIRDVQEQIAGKMRQPESGGNAVMQLNMGEGKSSVIVPIVAAALADGFRLVRVVVAKPQSKQMAQMLVSKMGGLLDRRVYRMPFSRSLKIGESEANAIRSICKECVMDGGILLVQPEHILSFKLMGLECFISGKETIGHSLVSTQDFFDASSRDIVDESDENFSVKFELIYTMGMQRPVEFSPDRWICIHQVLDLIRTFAPIVKKQFPFSIEVNEHRPGSFPRTRILQPDGQQQIFSLVAEHICETGLNGFPIARQSEVVRKAVLRYITELDLTTDEISQVENQGPSGFWADTTSSTLLLLRGLIAGGVLPFVFGQKRWRVNYGLDATRQPRTKLAVPYGAKDSPALRSEFSHPDVVIVLTSLSYYYGGLKNDDLLLAFDHLLKSDHADLEYQAWVKDAPDLPLAFRQIVGVNLKDRFQCIEQVFPPLRFAKSVIDYSLTHLVFPKEMKEFPHKLSASGWDLGQIKTHPTTGFSGTNDSRKTLPLKVQQLDLPEQRHTNALVLEYLLQPENAVAPMPVRKEGFSSDAEMLLGMVASMNPPAQVIIDVGAQILELNNLQVAKRWLEIMPDHNQTQAALFFDEEHDISVIDRQGHIESLQTSSFAKQLDVCLVFLDEVHTRGTDLRLPEHYRAAVTLGANLTKDRLVQACMRMRKLGQGQSVVFCVPPEIRTKILARTSKPDNIDVSDVLSWAIYESWMDMRRSMPLWSAQGTRFTHQSSIWDEVRTSGETEMSKDQAIRFLEDEAQSLEYRYRPRHGTDVRASLGFMNENQTLNLIRERCLEFDGLKLSSATLQEEQERELSPEIEEERQVQRPAPAQPAKHHVHPDLIKFVSTGTLIKGSKAYTPAFKTLRSTSAAAHLDVSQFGDGLLVTADFASTVQFFGTCYISDVNQRPVQWILTSIVSSCFNKNAVEHMMIISPHEAQELQANIRKSKTVALHLYAPRPNLGFRALDGLDLYTVPACSEAPSPPRQFVLQLNMFAGQLYLSSFTEYVEICEFLGLAWDKTEEGCVVAPDGFILQDSSGQVASSSRFRKSPVKFLQVLMTKIRRNCEGIEKTHMGTILDGRLLRRSDFEELEDGL